MATFAASQLLLIVLFSWNVHCFPATKGWSQQDPYEGSYSNADVRPGFYYGSSQGAPAQPSSLSYPAVEGVYSSTGTYPASASSAPDVSREASWNAAPAWDPVGVSTTAYSVSRTSQPASYSGLPPPPFFQAGELNHYEANVEQGNSERETEELSFPVPPPPPYVGFQAGELNRYTSILEHGNEERETEEQGFMPPPPYDSEPQEFEVSPASTLVPGQQVPQELMPVGPSQYYLFLTGQLPPGTYTHSQLNYEAGRDHWDEVHYERYDFPDVTQQLQDYTKI